MLKNEIREIYLEKRHQLSNKDLLILDDLLLIQLQNLYFDNPKVLLSYFPIENKNEPNTQLFNSYLKYNYAELEIAYPVSNFSNLSMKACLTNHTTEFQFNKYHIYEPVQVQEINLRNIDIVFVPLLAFDTLGFRVGYGKGFYDKFLQNHPVNLVKIGFSYFEPIDKIEDRNSFDVPLNYCITPHKIYEFE